MEYLLSMVGLEGVEGVAVVLYSMAVMGEGGEEVLKLCGHAEDGTRSTLGMGKRVG
jgi:hypothetical protein